MKSLKLVNKAVLAMLAASVAMSAAYADSYLHKIIEVPAASVSNYTYPVIPVADAKTFKLTVENPYPNTATIEFPDSGESYYLPWFSSVTVPVDLSKQPVNYVIKHGYYSQNGQYASVAGGAIGVSSAIASAQAAAGASASLAAFLDNSKATLDDLIRRNQYVATGGDAFAQDDADLNYQPVYTKRYVRGYW
jgi:hypothetical protein